MAYFGTFYLDKEKDIIVELTLSAEGMTYLLRTPNHAKGNLITNLARLCGLPLSKGEDGLKVICGEVPCYVDERNREVYVLRLADTKVANIYPDGTIERKAYIPAISKTLMSQTKDYRLDVRKTLVKTYIRREYKFRTDLHTHMNANLDADLLIALGVFHQIRYPLYYVKKLRLRCTEEQEQRLAKQREAVAVRSDETVANIAITLIHQADAMLLKLIEVLKRQFVQQGGIREEMTRARLSYRNGQYQKGEGSPQDKVDARRWLQKSAEQGNEDAKKELQNLLNKNSIKI